MTPVRAAAFALAAASVLATGGCGMFGLFDDGPSRPARSPDAAPRAAPGDEPDDAPPAPRVSVADKLTASDRIVIERAAARALARGTTGEALSWRNPGTGTQGDITPTSPSYRGSNRRLCRDYQLTVKLGAGGSETLVGTRCRGTGGRWPRAE
ncbi:MAG: RT0821/Lpp0805 family surface protein [Bauldia litoralis]